MTDEKDTTTKKQETSNNTRSETGTRPSSTRSRRSSSRGRSGGQRKNPRRSKRRGRRDNRRRSEFDQKIIDIRRVTRVVSGGRRFSFSVAAVVGDKKGRVGVGIGKANDTALAIEKAIRNGEKNVIKLNLTEDNSIPHELFAKYNASEVVLRPSPGRGLVSGSSVRDVVELAGITDVSSKLLSRSKNKINNARAAIKALRPLAK